MSASLLSLSRLQWSWTPQQAQNKMEDQEYFMAVAFLAAKQSPDTNSKVGACIVNTEKKIVGIGYNRMPIGCPAGSLPWARDNVDPLNNKYMYVCHAELNAIMNKNSADVKGCTIYVSLFPCNECTKIIIQSGIFARLPERSSLILMKLSLVSLIIHRLIHRLIDGPPHGIIFPLPLRGWLLFSTLSTQSN
ncbi:deoxycytidylate deaminase-like isoform X18 [Alosa alosa]|uniref:deoxycytidylate deaminase-like isoform X18 n=1 Tax=Alosa alosa TaxID=278164 RepID=UPI00201510B6|nr:deoxycytidylate deaminase-like isoform X18 [Alosa alosa]